MGLSSHTTSHENFPLHARDLEDLIVSNGDDTGSSLKRTIFLQQDLCNLMLNCW